MSTLTGLRPTKQRWLMIGLGLTGLLLYARHFHSRDVKHHRFEAAVNKMKDMPVEMGPEATAFNLSGRSLFVSYHGVLTLVYDGWSPAAMAVKDALHRSSIPWLRDNHFPGVFHRERGGSLFPKTSLAALCEGCQLTDEEYQTLTAICSHWTEKMRRTHMQVTVGFVSIVTVRDLMLSHSKVIKTVRLPKRTDGTPSIVTEAGSAVVDKVLAEADDPGYIHQVNKQGNHFNHYKHRANHGATAISRLQHAHSWYLFQVWLAGVQSDIESQLPGKYHFFDVESLHITIRGLWVDRAAKGGTHHDSR